MNETRTNDPQPSKKRAALEEATASSKKPTDKEAHQATALKIREEKKIAKTKCGHCEKGGKVC
jgi:hypothetical protein